MLNNCNVDEWVEIECVLLGSADRAPGLPEDTAAQPLKMWVKGFARSVAVQGQPVEIETMTGRRLTGTLVEVNPGYTHSFGKQPAELAHIGRDLRARVAEHRTSEAEGSDAGSGADEADDADAATNDSGATP